MAQKSFAQNVSLFIHPAMSLITRQCPEVAAYVPLFSLERPSFETEQESGEPIVSSFSVLGTQKNGEAKRYKISPHAFTQLVVGKGTAKKPQPPYLCDTFRRFILCLDKKVTDPTAEVIRVDMYREQNVSWNFKAAPGTKAQDSDAEVEISDNPAGDLFLRAMPTGMKTDEHARPILAGLSKMKEIKLDAVFGAGVYKVNRIEGRVAYIGLA